MPILYQCDDGIVHEAYFGARRKRSDAYLYCPGPSLGEITGADEGGRKDVRGSGRYTVGLNTACPRVLPDAWVTGDPITCYDRDLWFSGIQKFSRASNMPVFVNGWPLAQCPSTWFYTTTEKQDLVRELLKLCDHKQDFAWNRQTFWSALHLLLYQGFRRIYLVGCDFGGSRSYHDRDLSKGHDAKNRLLYAEQVRVLEQVAPALIQVIGAELVSCTPDSPVNEFMRYQAYEDACLESQDRWSRPCAGDDRSLYHSEVARHEGPRMGAFDRLGWEMQESDLFEGDEYFKNNFHRFSQNNYGYYASIVRELKLETAFVIGVRSGYDSRSMLEANPRMRIDGIDIDDGVGGISGYPDQARRVLGERFPDAKLDFRIGDSQIMPGLPRHYQLGIVDGLHTEAACTRDILTCARQCRYVLIHDYDSGAWVRNSVDALRRAYGWRWQHIPSTVGHMLLDTGLKSPEDIEEVNAVEAARWWQALPVAGERKIPKLKGPAPALGDEREEWPLEYLDEGEGEGEDEEADRVMRKELAEIRQGEAEEVPTTIEEELAAQKSWAEVGILARRLPEKKDEASFPSVGAPVMLSVVAPCCNRLDDLKRVLPTWLSQNFLGVMEIVVVDWFCPEGTADYVRSLGDHRVRVVKAEGVPGRFDLCRARNLGIQSAHGKYTLILDCDTELCDDRLFSDMVTRLQADVEEGRFSYVMMAPSGVSCSQVALSTRALRDVLGGYDESFELGCMEEHQLRMRMDAAGFLRHSFGTRYHLPHPSTHGVGYHGWNESDRKRLFEEQGYRLKSGELWVNPNRRRELREGPAQAMALVTYASAGSLWMYEGWDDSLMDTFRAFEEAPLVYVYVSGALSICEYEMLRRSGAEIVWMTDRSLGWTKVYGGSARHWFRKPEIFADVREERAVLLDLDLRFRRNPVQLAQTSPGGLFAAPDGFSKIRGEDGEPHPQGAGRTCYCSGVVVRVGAAGIVGGKEWVDFNRAYWREFRGDQDTLSASGAVTGEVSPTWNARFFDGAVERDASIVHYCGDRGKSELRVLEG